MASSEVQLSSVAAQPSAKRQRMETLPAHAALTERTNRFETPAATPALQAAAHASHRVTHPCGDAASYGIDELSGAASASDNTEALHSRDTDAAAAGEARRSRRLRSFYGNPRQTAVELRVQRFLQGVKLRLQPSAPYKVFPQQAQAFEFADAHAHEHDLRIFSVELNAKGARHFIATTHDGFWGRYQRLPPGGRHFYEVVREGSPCHLYFDLEFRPECNPGADGDALVDALLRDVSAAAERHFGVSLDAAAHTLELDSSTPQKFSRHLLVLLPGAAFGSNRDVGTFVAQLLGDCLLDGPYAVAKDDEGGEACFVDMSVYSRNRAFRLYLSSKAGKQATLQPTARLRPVPASQREVFMESLICNVPPDAQLLHCGDATAPAWQTARQPAGGRRPAAAPAAGVSQAQRPPSPHPAVDAFLATVCTQGGSQGYVRTWTAVDDTVLLYGIGGNRWCGNIGRQHKSNGVYIVVDLAAGQWWQKCFDPDCRAFRSIAEPLPPGIVPRLVPSQDDSSRGLTWHRCNEGVLAGQEEEPDDAAALAAAADELEADAAGLRALEALEAQQMAAAGVAVSSSTAAADEPEVDAAGLWTLEKWESQQAAAAGVAAAGGGGTAM